MMLCFKEEIIISYFEVSVCEFLFLLLKWTQEIVPSEECLCLHFHSISLKVRKV